MQKMILLGDEAIAQGAIDAGLSGIYAYPGTPSTEITEYIIASKEAKNNDIVANWTANEKTAVENCAGYVVCRQKGHGLHETCRAECSSRPIYQLGSYRN